MPMTPAEKKALLAGHAVNKALMEAIRCVRIAKKKIKNFGPISYEMPVYPPRLPKAPCELPPRPKPWPKGKPHRVTKPEIEKTLNHIDKWLINVKIVVHKSMPKPRTGR